MFVQGRYRMVVLHESLRTTDSFRLLCEIINPLNPVLQPLEYSRDGCATVLHHRLRYCFAKHLLGEEITLRILPARIPLPREINLPPQMVDKFCRLTDGLVCFAGSTGDGKSTSIASLVRESARRVPSRVITIEDPVEYLQEEMTNGSTFTYRTVGLHCASFLSAMESALRQRPDIIVIGEIRDAKTAAVVFQAALSGCKVITTIHGCDVQTGMQRLGDFARDLGTSGLGALAQSFRMCIAQKLEKKISRDGVVPLHEILVANGSVLSKIRAGDFFKLNQDMEEGASEGMQPFKRSAFYHHVQR